MFRKALIPLAGLLLGASAPAFAHDGDWDYRRANPPQYLDPRIEAERDAALAHNGHLTPWERRRLIRQLRRERAYQYWLRHHRYPYWDRYPGYW